MEPCEAARVASYPNEFHTAQSAGWIRIGTKMPYLFQNACPGCDTDSCANQNSDFIVEDILGRCTKRSIDFYFWHLLGSVEHDFVHSHAIEFVVEFGLRLTGTYRISQSACEISHLSNMHRNIGIEGA